jgi:hypothetical protein
MTKIIAFAGTKQAGKNTAANILAGTILHAVGYETSVDNTTGDLLLLDDESKFVKIDLLTRKPEIREWLNENIYPFVKMYSFADSLKEFCINVLGLTEEQCYGTNEQKNSKTHIKWNVFRKFLNKDTYEEINKKNCWNKYCTGREIQQIVGTDIVRSINPDGWVNNTFYKINKERPRHAILVDTRFPNEVTGTQKNGGIVIKLTRCPFKDEDLHSSERALNNYVGFDGILDNQNMSIEEQGVALAQLLQKIW